MSDTLLSALADIKQSATRLNLLTDTTAEKIRRLEDFLESCNIGISVSLEMDDCEESELRTRLGYVRVGKKFRIAVALDSRSPYVPWSDCSRDSKLLTVSHLPTLIQALAEQVNLEVQRAEVAAATVDKVLAAVAAPPAASQQPDPLIQMLNEMIDSAPPAVAKAAAKRKLSRDNPPDFMGGEK